MRLLLILCLAAAATRAQAQAPRSWNLAADKAAPEVTLFYGAPQTDDVVLALKCPRQTGQVTVSFSVAARLADRQSAGVWVDKIGRPAPWPASVVLTSGIATTTLRGQAMPDDLDGGTWLAAEVSTRAPVIAAFKKTGVLSASGLGQNASGPPAPLKLVRPFLSACR